MVIRLIKLPYDEEFAKKIVKDVLETLGKSLKDLPSYGGKAADEIAFEMSIEGVLGLWIAGMLDLFEVIEGPDRVGFIYVTMHRPLFEADPVATVEYACLREDARGKGFVQDAAEYLKTVYQAKGCSFIHVKLPVEMEKVMEGIGFNSTITKAVKL